MHRSIDCAKMPPLLFPVVLEEIQNSIWLAPLSISENDKCLHGITAGTEKQYMNLGIVRESHPESKNDLGSNWKNNINLS